MPQDPGQDADAVIVFEDPAGMPAGARWLINAANVQGSGLNADAARWARVRNLTIRDLWHALGFRNPGPPENIGRPPNNRVEQLIERDWHFIGQCFASHLPGGTTAPGPGTGPPMVYPQLMHACCCCI